MATITEKTWPTKVELITWNVSFFAENFVFHLILLFSFLKNNDLVYNVTAQRYKFV